MCRMIGAPLGLPGRFLIEPFLRMAQGLNTLNEWNTEFGKITHGNGWGAVYEDEGRMRPLRGLRPCWEDPAIKTLPDKPVFLLHARRNPTGGAVLENTHPFEREIEGDDWFFCHNGTVGGLDLKGRTDSQRIFERLLPYIREDRVLAGLRETYCQFRDFTSLNSFLLGPGTFWGVCLYSENPDYYTLTLTETKDGPIVSSEPLGELAGGRTDLPNGTVLRIDRRTGRIQRYSLDCPARD